MNRHVIGGMSVLAALVSVGIPIASADPGDRCESKWNTMYTVPIGVRTTCYHPDGSYKVCSSLGTDGNGPGTCWDYPAPPQMNGQPMFSPPVPGHAASTTTSRITALAGGNGHAPRGARQVHPVLPQVGRGDRRGLLAGRRLDGHMARFAFEAPVTTIRGPCTYAARP